MRYFLDAEFIESGPRRPLFLMSLGIVAEDGRELYVVNRDCPLDLSNNWVKENVIPHLQPEGNSEHLSGIRQLVLEFCDRKQYGDPIFFGWYADYDWVTFCQIFGTMMDLPAGFPMYCRDLKQTCDELGNPLLPPQASQKHNALHDARWNKQVWEFLCGLPIPTVGKRMTDQEIICTFMARIYDGKPGYCVDTRTPWWEPDPNRQMELVPVTLTLDKLHLVEARLNDDQWWFYQRALCPIEEGRPMMVSTLKACIHATAEQKSKALAAVLRSRVELAGAEKHP